MLGCSRSYSGMRASYPNSVNVASVRSTCSFGPAAGGVASPPLPQAVAPSAVIVMPSARTKPFRIVLTCPTTLLTGMSALTAGSRSGSAPRCRRVCWGPSPVSRGRNRSVSCEERSRTRRGVNVKLKRSELQRVSEGGAVGPRAGDEERPTLEDVAAFAGVSRSTASRALNDDAYVSAAAREMVHAAARDLGYPPNQAARSLVTRRTGAIAVVLSEPEARLLDDPYRTAVMRAGYRELADIGRQMVLIFSDTREDLSRTVRFLEGGHVDGALVFAPHRADPLPKALRLLRIPVVFGGQAAGIRRGVHVVDFDNEGGARLAVEHL